MTLSPGLRSLRARIGAYALHARRDARETTAAARAAFLERFAREVDPYGLLPLEERTRRAICARRAFFGKLALRSAVARREKSSATPPARRAQREGAAAFPVAVRAAS